VQQRWRLTVEEEEAAAAVGRSLRPCSKPQVLFVW